MCIHRLNLQGPIKETVFNPRGSFVFRIPLYTVEDVRHLKIFFTVAGDFGITALSSHQEVSRKMHRPEKRIFSLVLYCRESA